VFTFVSSSVRSGFIQYFESIVSYWQAVDLNTFYLINKGLSNMIFDIIMPWLTHIGDFWAGWIFILIIIIINRKPIERGLRLGLFLSIIYGLVSGSQLIIRHLANRPRPFLDHDVIVRFLCPTDPSFPSGHAVTAFMIAVILSFQFPKYKYVFYFLACLVSFSRVYLGVHYPSDVIVGALIGYGITKLLISHRLASGQIYPAAIGRI
jgi:undecaprenyl-diphosphatase